MNYRQHKEKWIDCERCELCQTRRRVVLLRASRIPTDILFIGEAPGESEDILGKPFVGPAGKLLDAIIQSAGVEEGEFAITNLIACIPRDDDGDKISAPPKFAVQACAERLRECYELVDPKLLVLVGSEAKKWAKKSLTKDQQSIPTIDIIHPAAILRMNPAQKGLVVQRTVVTLADAVEEMKGE